MSATPTSLAAPHAPASQSGYTPAMPTKQRSPSPGDVFLNMRTLMRCSSIL